MVNKLSETIWYTFLVKLNVTATALQQKDLTSMLLTLYLSPASSETVFSFVFLYFVSFFCCFFLANLNYSKPYTNSFWTGNLGRWVVVKYLLENRREEKISSLKSLNFHMKLIGFQNQFEIQFLFYKNNPFPKLFISLLTLMWVLLFDSKSTKTKWSLWNS